MERLSPNKGFLTCICAAYDPLSPADHGLVGEEGSFNFNPETSTQGCKLLLEG